MHIPGKLNVAADALSRNNMCFHAGSSSGPSANCNGPSTGFAVSTRHHMDDVQELDQAVQRYFVVGLTSTTHKTYLSAEHLYLSVAVFVLIEEQACNNIHYNCDRRADITWTKRADITWTRLIWTELKFIV